MKGRLQYLKDVVTLSFDAAKCTGCGRCVEVCPHGVFQMQDGEAVIVERDACIECGACMRNCAFEAVSVITGVGCANAIIRGAIKGTPPDCSCSSSADCC